MDKTINQSKKVSSRRSDVKMKKKKVNKSVFVIFLILVVLGVSVYMLHNSEGMQKKNLEKKLSDMAEEYYSEYFVTVAKSYMQKRGKININLDALRDYGKDVSIFENKKTGKKCTDFGTYVTITINPDSVKNWNKDYKVEKVVLDCFK